MKNIFKLIGIIAIVAVIGFSFAACGGDDGDDDGGNGGLGDNLSLSGQVYTMGVDSETTDFIYNLYTGQNRTFTSNVEGSGSITNGKLSFNAGVPNRNILEPFEDEDLGGTDYYSDVTCNPKDTMGVSLEFSGINLEKNYWSYNSDPKNPSATIEGVTYLYVDRNCTVTAKGGTFGEGSGKTTVPNMKLNLKKGWNVVNVRLTGSDAKGSTFTTRTGDLSSCKWVLGD